MLIRSFFALTAARLVFAAFTILALSAAAKAQFLTFVAATGNDGNTCLVQAAPCKTLQRAIDVTSAAGEIRILSQLPLQNGTIAKSLTVNGGGHTLLGKIVINSASAVVTLRDLRLNGRGLNNQGIRIDSAAAVHIEDCTVERYTEDGIKLSATTATRLFVSDTVSRDNSGSGLLASDANAHVTVEDSRFENNGNTGVVLSVAGANVTRSIASRNATGIYMSVGKMSLTETTAADNSNGFYLANGEATLASSVGSSNGTGLTIAEGASATITDSVFTNNTTGIVNSAGTVFTLQNNTVLRNTVNYDTSGVLDPEPAF